MKEITHVFFDLDHTLWDYDRNARETLLDLMVEFGIHEMIDADSFVVAYNNVNEALWHQYNHGQIDKDHIRYHRFPSVLKQLGLQTEHKAEHLHEFFVSNCSSKPNVMPHTMEVLHYLRDRYPMAIITNGFEESQRAKMRASGLEGFFSLVVTSETIGYRKPQKEIFHHSIEKMGGKPATSVMIGDNPNTDIQGAENAGMKAIFYNPTGHGKSVTEWQIARLDELVGIL